MKTTHRESSLASPVDEGLNWSTRTARNMVLRALDQLEVGALIIWEQGSSRFFGDPLNQETLQGEIHVDNPEFYKALLLGGSVGAGESYMRGEWSSPDLCSVVRLLSRNMDVLNQLEGGLAALKRPIAKLLHFFNRNTRSGSRRNIAAHYDLDNSFFQAWLSEDMMYSAAIFPREDASIEQASFHKLQHICEKLALSVDDHVLEIGAGWGGFAVFAAKHYGCKVTTTTISEEQFRYAQTLIEREGLTDQITLLQQDYRELTGTYDKLVSIEMVEAVGAPFLDRFLQVCAARLKPDGLMLIQAITIPDNRYASALKEVDFIKRYIFPGSFIPSVSALCNAQSRTDLRMIHMEDLAPHYARTLACWRENLEDKIRVGSLVLPDSFRRMWLFYLAYCEGGFWERVIGSAQIVFAKPLNRREPIIQGLGWNAGADLLKQEMSGIGQ